MVAQKDLRFRESVTNHYPELLNPQAQKFLVALHKKFNGERLRLLNNRKKQQEYFDAGNFPSFPAETQAIRNGNWTAATTPNDLQDRRVEITGPVDRKMVINALNSGARAFMADFEDSNAPTWDNCMQGQINLRDANLGTIRLEDERRGKIYELNKKTAVLLVRPRGLHLDEANLEINGTSASGSLFDFGLYAFHNTKTLMEKGSAPYFYLPKLEHYLEARWWNEIFTFTEKFLSIPHGTLKATVLIETITASFQLDEIIYELRDHIVGLNCGRWDYIFSYIKKFRNHHDFVVPNRDQVTMTSPFMDAYSRLVIQNCHKRGIHAIGGMAAQIPIKNDEQANKNAFEKVRLDKEREVMNGHDGTWVAHPALVQVALNEFDKHMPNPNQKEITREQDVITESDLVALPEGTITEDGVRKNINVGILYLEAWLRGYGAVALYNLMEDAATAEISRTQLWQWLHNRVRLEDGRIFSTDLYQSLFDDELESIKKISFYQSSESRIELASRLFDEMIRSQEFEEFLTLKAQPYL
nr:malate synthase A [Nonlabens spongiae]